MRPHRPRSPLPAAHPSPVDRHGFVRYRHWRFYGERGLAGAEAAVWVFGNDLTVEYASETLAQYHLAYAPDGRAIRRVSAPRLFGTRYPSPQPFLRALGELAWRPALRLPCSAPRRRRAPCIDQEPLFLLDNERAANEG